jgi:hypothetical protein
MPVSTSFGGLASGYGNARILTGRVMAVNKTRWTVDVLCANGEFPQGIPIMPAYVGMDGQGSFYLPEVDSLVMICYPSEGTTPFILGGCAVNYETETDDEVADDYRMNRPVLNEGDHMVSSKDGNFVIVRRGGVVELGASQVARRFYVPLSNMIRDFCENYELHTAGGSLTWRNRRDDEKHEDGEGGFKVPVEFQFQCKDFSGDTPLIDLRFGRILAEDDQKCVTGAKGNIIGSLDINNKFKMWIDKKGNLDMHVSGGVVRSYERSVVEHFATTHIHEVQGQYKNFVGAREEEVVGDDKSSAGNRWTTVYGKLTAFVGGAVSEVTGPRDEVVNGDLVREIIGAKDERILGNSAQDVAGTKMISSGESTQEAVGGRKTVDISNSNNEDLGYEVKLSKGAIQIFNLTGEVQVLSGGADGDAALSRITMKPGGATLVESKGTSTCEVNKTGVSVFTKAGEVTVDLNGTVYMGPPGGGGVITTLTHPVDFITGAPIKGSKSVVAGGAESLTQSASTFVSEA